jgi:hypothetical protein
MALLYAAEVAAFRTEPLGIELERALEWAEEAEVAAFALALTVALWVEVSGNSSVVLASAPQMMTAQRSLVD